MQGVGWVLRFIKICWCLQKAAVELVSTAVIQSIIAEFPHGRHTLTSLERFYGSPTDPLKGLLAPRVAGTFFQSFIKPDRRHGWGGGGSCNAS